MYPEVAQFSQQYTYSTRGRVSPPRGSGTASESQTQSLLGSEGRRAPTAPLAGSAPGSCATGAAGIRPRWGRTPPGRWQSVTALPAAPVPRGEGRARRRRVGGEAVNGGAAGAGGGSGAPNQGRCCRWAGCGGAGRVAPAAAGCRGGCSAPPGPPVAGPPGPPAPALCPSLPLPPLRPVLPARCGPHCPPPLASGFLPCRRPLAPVRPLRPASLPVSLAMSCAPPIVACALAFPVRLPPPAAACASAFFCAAAPLCRYEGPGPSPVSAPAPLLPAPMPPLWARPPPLPLATFPRLPSVPCPAPPRFAARPARSPSPPCPPAPA